MGERSDLEARTREYYRMVDAGDIDGVIAWFAEDGTYHRPGYPPMVGAAALRAFYGGERVIESGAHRLDAVLVDGTSVAVHGRFTGRLRDGSQATVGFADFLVYDTSTDGPARVVQRRTFFDVAAV